MRQVLGVLILLHGLIHLIGAAKGLQVAKVAALHHPISRAGGIWWLCASVVLVTAGTLLVLDQHWWWVLAALGAALSQWLIGSVWADAKFGTIANVIILLPALLAAAGPGVY